MIRRHSVLALATAFCLATPILQAQQDKLVPAPDRRPGEGAGPYPTLTIRNVMLIDGTGARRPGR
jgi:hypothetical protein